MTTPRHQRPAGLKTFLFGVPYYPEHWSDADRRQDAQRMADADVNVVRMAEFAWDRIEPARGKFDFSLFDETIAALGEKGIETILCTPTATPPRWLTMDHPEWMRVDADGRPMEHGQRQHCCTTNEAFRAESVRITRAMAEHYADNPHVIGWQTDNELYCHFSECFCPACRAAFPVFLRERYGSIDALNAAWGTAFWAQTYDSFEQVPLAYPSQRPAYPSPSHELDWRRFLSATVTEFQRQQVEVLRQVRDEWFVFHNGLFRDTDYWRFAEDLDFLGVDVYPGFAVSSPSDAIWAAGLNERCRANSGGYIIPEQQGGAGGQKPYLHDAVAPGQMRLWAYQSIAHGADGMLHFRWRTCRGGAEIYWNGILDHDNVPRRRYDEFAREGSELSRIGSTLLNSVADVRLAVLVDDEQDWAHDAIAMDLPGPKNQASRAYEQLWLRRLPCGYVHARDSFDGLELIVLPSMPLADEALGEKLEAFVRDGGVLVVTPRTFTRDAANCVLSDTPPGLIGALTGAAVVEFGKVSSGLLNFSLHGRELPAGGAYEVLALDGGQAAATWLGFDDGRPCAADGAPAVALNHVGEGTVLTVGTYLTEQNASAILGFALTFTSLTPLADADDGVEVTARVRGGRRFTFVLNHNPHPAGAVGLPRGRELLSNTQPMGELQLPAYGVAIIDSEA
ncbi:MAG: beta-galactosidase [Phycisphaerae bacterium]